MVRKILKELANPDFWKMLGLFAVLFGSAFAFFYVAWRYDFLARASGALAKACKEPENAQAFLLFLSPFVLAVSFLLSLGELMSEMDNKKQRGLPIRWGRVGGNFALSFGLLGAALWFMIGIC